MDKETIRQNIAKSAVFVVVAIAVMIFITSFFQLPKLEHIVYHNIASNHFVQRLIAIALLAIAFNLYQRKRRAWLVSVIALSISLFIYLGLHYHTVTIAIIIMQIYALWALLISQDFFKRPSGIISVKNAGIMIGLIFAVVFFNAVIGYFILRGNVQDPVSFTQSLIGTGRMLIIPKSDIFSGYTYELFVFFFVWISIAVCAFMMLRTAAIHRSFTKTKQERARDLVKEYGQNSTSYLALEEDKSLFFGKDVEGVVAYGIVGGTVVVLGDPICAPENFLKLLAEFKSFCTESSLDCVFLGTTDVFLEQYKALGYGHIKCGEEARFYLPDYNISGGVMANFRTKINKANKEHIDTLEYKPLEKRDPVIEKKMQNISEQWLGDKKSGQLGFTQGSLGFDDPMDRRYFYATDAKGEIVAFHIFTPFGGMNGYGADITRRIHDAPRNVTEKINYDAFMVFKEEGVEWGTLGLAPLANEHAEAGNDEDSSKLLEFVYEHFNRFYGFKTLYIAKEKYHHTKDTGRGNRWEYFGHMLRQNRHAYTKQNDHTKALARGDADQRRGR